MSSDNDINKVIKGKKNDLKNQSSEEEVEENSFNQLLSLQLLIQKHSGLKELCKNIYYLILFIFIIFK